MFDDTCSKLLHDDCWYWLSFLGLSGRGALCSLLLPVFAALSSLALSGRAAPCSLSYQCLLLSFIPWPLWQSSSLFTPPTMLASHSSYPLHSLAEQHLCSLHLPVFSALPKFLALSEISALSRAIALCISVGRNPPPSCFCNNPGFCCIWYSSSNLCSSRSSHSTVTFSRMALSSACV